MGHQNGVRHVFFVESDGDVLPGSQCAEGVVESQTHLQGAGGLVYRPVDHVEGPETVVHLTIGEDHLKFAVFGALAGFLSALELEVVLLADGELHVDRVGRRDGRQDRVTWADQAARINVEFADSSAYRCGDVSVVEVDLCSLQTGERTIKCGLSFLDGGGVAKRGVLDFSLLCIDLSLGHVAGRHGLVVELLGNDLLLY